MPNRIAYIDFLRGLAILFVIMGHIIQYNLYGESGRNCFDFIYSFHMGFFFFISGYVACISSYKYKFSYFLPFLRKKSVQLLLPFFTVGGAFIL